jgi:hypothetical protein
VAPDEVREILASIDHAKIHARVTDSRLDLGAGADNALILHQRLNIVRAVSGDDRRIEPVEGPAESLAPMQNGAP